MSVQLSINVKSGRLLLAACVLLAVISAAQGCPKVLQVLDIFKSRISSIKQPSCFTVSSMRTMGQDEGTYDHLGDKLSAETCRTVCTDKGHKGDIISMSLKECHCSKDFKKDGVADLSKCSDLCPGNAKEHCGGPDHVSAYPKKP